MFECEVLFPLIWSGKGILCSPPPKIDKDIEDAVSDGTDKLFYDDPLNLAIPYTFLLKRLPEPPDGPFKYMLSLTLILFVCFYPVVRGLILYWYRSIFASLLDKYNRNFFVRHGIQRRAKCKPMPTLYSRVFAAENYHSKDYFSLDTYEIPFVIDKSTTSIISIKSRLFTCLLTPT